jgi:hypothetical protein
MSEKMRFQTTTLKSLDWCPSDEGSTFVLVLRAPLTVALATAMRVRGLCYSEPDGNMQKPKKEQVHPSPRSNWEGKIGVQFNVDGGDVTLGDRTFGFSVAHKFKIGRDEKAEDTDITLYVTFRIKIDGAELMLYKFAQDTKKKPFTLIMTPAQGALDYGDEDEEGDAEEDEGQEAAAASSGTLARKGAMVTQ